MDIGHVSMNSNLWTTKNQQQESEQPNIQILNTESLDEDDESTLMLNKINQGLFRRISAPSAQTCHRMLNSPSVQSISTILLKAPSDRTQSDYDDIHRFMTDNVKMFQDLSNTGQFTKPATGKNGDQESKLSYEDCMNLYQVLMHKVYRQGDKMCEYGQTGDRFFIILSGRVSVLQPKETKVRFNLMWDLYKYVIEVHELVVTYRDEKSKAMGHMVSIVGAPLLRQLAFKHVRKLTDFLRKLESLNEELFDSYPSLDRRKIHANPHRLNVIRVALDDQLL